MNGRRSPWPKGRGGARPGAGRPKRDFWSKLEIGQACEVLWRKASEAAVRERLSRQPFSSEIKSLQDTANKIPVAARRQWLEGDAFKEHVGDLESWLHKRSKTPFDEQAATYLTNAPRVVNVSTRPPRGTRTRIIAAVADQYQVPESTVVRLWSDYRKLEGDLDDPD